jgi:HK97 family phage major capsid protein
MTNAPVHDPRVLAEGIADTLLGDGGPVDERIRSQVAAQITNRVEDLGLTEIGGTLDEIRARLAAPPPRIERGPSSIMSLLNPSMHNPQAIGAEIDGRFGTFSEFIRTVVGDANGRRDDRLVYVNEDADRVRRPGEGSIRADLGGDAVATGGALVPEEFRADLMLLALQDATIRPRAMVLPMASSSLKLPAIRDTSHASNVFGGVTAYWTKPGGTITESQPTFAQIALNAHGLKFLTEVENELLADSAITLEALLVRLFTAAITWFEEQAFIRGDGAGEPVGIINANCAVSVTRATTSEVNYLDIVNMWARMLPASQGRAVWMANPDVFPQLAQMALNVGTGGSAIWINNGVEGPPARIFGRPLIFNEHMTTMGTVGDIALVDWGMYLIGDRQALSLASSSHAGFENDLTKFRGVERLDAQPWLETAVNPAQGSNTLSPIVLLAT